MMMVAMTWPRQSVYLVCVQQGRIYIHQLMPSMKQFNFNTDVEIDQSDPVHGI